MECPDIMNFETWYKVSVLSLFLSDRWRGKIIFLALYLPFIPLSAEPVKHCRERAIYVYQILIVSSFSLSLFLLLFICKNIQGMFIVFLVYYPFYHAVIDFKWLNRILAISFLVKRIYFVFCALVSCWFLVLSIYTLNYTIGYYIPNCYKNVNVSWHLHKIS